MTCTVHMRSLSRGKFTSVVLFSDHTWCAVRSRASLCTVVRTAHYQVMEVYMYRGSTDNIGSNFMAC